MKKGADAMSLMGALGGMRVFYALFVFAAWGGVGGALGARAETLEIPFPADARAPVSIEADAFKVDQAKESAVFTGNVRVEQGPVRLKADQVSVIYSRKKGQSFSSALLPRVDITSIKAVGNVCVAMKPDRLACSKWANYDVATRRIQMGGGVLLKQKEHVLRGGALDMDLIAGISVMRQDAGGDDVAGEGAAPPKKGRVRGLFRPASN